MRQDNVEVRVARIFNTFGPRMNPYDGRVVSNFIIQALKGEDMTVCVLPLSCSCSLRCSRDDVGFNRGLPMRTLGLPLVTVTAARPARSSTSTTSLTASSFS